MTPGTIVVPMQKMLGRPLWVVRSARSRLGGAARRFCSHITEMTYAVGSGYYVLTFEGGELKHSEYFQN
jgi:hypothetical protein